MTAPETVGTQINQNEEQFFLASLHEENSLAEQLDTPHTLDKSAILPIYDDSMEAFEDDFDDVEVKLEIALYEARLGDPDAVSFLLNALSATIIKAAVPVGVSYADREDYIQNATEKIYKELILRPDAYLTGTMHGFVFRVARNATWDEVRKNNRHGRLVEWDERIDKVVAAPDEVNLKAAHDKVVDLLHKSGCNKEFIMPVILSHVYGYSYDEIALLTGLKKVTVGTRIHRGLNQVRDAWGIKVDKDNKPAVRDLFSEDLPVSA